MPQTCGASPKLTVNARRVPAAPERTAATRDIRFSGFRQATRATPQDPPNSTHPEGDPR
ncbi:hypothetical protein [Streptomyces sp. NPDC088554]|uniref:hypothetical protein n=1 Tax=Streptomyces sp. NPDC088554 TaxID=3365865 RepID=UPI00381F3CFB